MAALSRLYVANRSVAQNGGSGKNTGSLKGWIKYRAKGFLR